MTQSTLAIIEAHEDEREIDDVHSYQRTPRPFRRADRTTKGRRTVALGTNGRNSSRSTFKSFGRSKRADVLKTATA